MLEAYRLEINRTDDFSAAPSAIYNDLLTAYLDENREISEAAIPQGNPFGFLINCFGYSKETVEVCDYAIPTFEQIKAPIDAGFPLLCFVERGAPGNGFDKDEGRYFPCVGDDGHAIIICGYDETGGSRNILVADPALDGITTIPYSPTEYCEEKYVDRLYWWATILKEF
jgi:hypothetical protein